MVKKLQINSQRVTLDPYGFKRTSVRRLVRDEKPCDHRTESHFHPGVWSRSDPRVLTGGYFNHYEIQILLVVAIASSKGTVGTFVILQQGIINIDRDFLVGMFI